MERRNATVLIIAVVLFAITSALYADLPVTNGLALHLDASDASSLVAADGHLDNGDKISAWGPAVQADPVHQPTWVAEVDAMAGKPGVFFSSPASTTSNDGTIMLISSLLLEENVTVFMATQNYKQTTWASSVHRPVLAADNNPYQNAGTGYGIGYNKGNKPNIVVSMGAVYWEDQLYAPIDSIEYDYDGRVYTFRRNGGGFNESELFERKADGAGDILMAAGTITRTSGFTSGYYLGGEPSVWCRHYDGHVSEIVVYNRRLDDTERQQVSDYLHARYLVPTKCGHPGTSYGPTDFNQDCQTDLSDFSTLAHMWMKCSDPCNAECSKYWRPAGLASQQWDAWRTSWGDSFPLAAWGYFRRYDATLEEFMTYKNAGLTMVQIELEHYDNAVAAGLRLVTGSWHDLFYDLGQLDYYMGFQTPTDETTTGYQLKDEPNPTMFEQLGEAAVYVYYNDQKDAIPMVNMLPNWAVPYSRFNMSYEDYLDNYISQGYPAMLIHTHYPPLCDGTDRPEYYENIELFRDRALQHDIGLLGFISVTPYNSGTGVCYRPASESDIRWQVYSHLAYGAQGIWYYNWRIGDDYRFGEGLVLHETGEPNPASYALVQAVNAEVVKIGPVLLTLRSVGVFHTAPNLPSGVTAYSNGVVTGVTGFTGTEFIIGELANQDDPDDTSVYLMVVNKRHAANTTSASLPASTTITVDPAYAYVYQYNSSTGDLEVLTGEGNGYTIQLDGGQGLLMRLSSTSLLP